MQLRLQNFQSWESAELNIQGLTVIVGPSNLGKSAFIRALRGVIRNDIPDRRVRKVSGVKSVTARVSTDIEGMQVEASRTSGKGSVSYTVDGEEFTKLAGVPPPCIEALNYGLVEIGEHKFDPIFAGQFDGQFLLSSSPAEISAVLNAFSSTERLDRGRKVLTLRIATINAEAKALGKVMSRQEDDLASVAATLAQAQPAMAQVDTFTQTVTRLHRVTVALNTLFAARKRSAEVTETLAQVTLVAQLVTSGVMGYKTARNMHQLRAARTLQTKTRTQLEGLGQVEASRVVALGSAKTLALLQSVLNAHSTKATAQTRIEHVEVVTHNLEGIALYVRYAFALKGVQEARKISGRVNHALPVLAVLQTRLTALVRLWNARIRITNLVRLNAERIQVPELELASIQSLISQRQSELKALGLVARMQAMKKPDTTMFDADLLMLTQERDTLMQQLHALTQSATTCPKCKHQFHPALGA